jgi:hypothetical protein
VPWPQSTPQCAKLSIRTCTLHTTARRSKSELTPEEGRQLFDRLARAELGVSGEEFLRRLTEGDIPEEWSEDAVTRLEILTPFAA